MTVVECADNEEIVRVIRSADWDEAKKQYSSDLFKDRSGDGVSVSRLAILSLNRILSISCKDIHKPPKNKVIKAGIISVQKLKQIGLNRTGNRGKSIPFDLKVVPDPIHDDPVLMDNPSHALVQPGKISRGLARQIINNLELKSFCGCFLNVLFRNLESIRVMF